MKDYETFKPLQVVRAEGSYIELANGKKVIDAISSWWCKSLGHQHPRLKEALLKQLDHFEHVIFANSTNDIIEELSHRLTQLSPTLKKVFYTGDGSCAVEVAMKMSLHARKIAGDHQRQQFIALKNGYHGETVGAMSVSDIGMYRKPYENMLFSAEILSCIPYVSDINDPLWLDCGEYWEKAELQLRPYTKTATAIILEPILQGAGGMLVYSRDFLKRLQAWASEHHVHVIADEIMTGLGRTGKMLACDHADIQPDFLCLGKGLTSGWMPFSAVLTTNQIYDHFYDDYSAGKAFLHSHTFSGHVLGASVALEVLKVMEDENTCEQANLLGKILFNNMQAIANKTNRLSNIRTIGAMVAADLVTDHPDQRLGYDVFQRAIQLGAWLRPLGNTIYWLPPLNTKATTVSELKEITERALM
jgi:adenosylmethionine-8-amino-7-oxononanoate aminotransferase